MLGVIQAYAATKSNFGGSEILGVGQEEKWHYDFFRPEVIRQFQMFTWVKVLIIILLVILGIVTIWRIFGIHNILTGKAIKAASINEKGIKQRDWIVLQSNSLLRFIVKLVKGRGIHIKEEDKAYTQYNLERANILVPGGFRVMTPDEYYSCCVLLFGASIVVGVVIAVFRHIVAGIVIVGAGYVSFMVIPMILIRNTVALKDNEVRDNFSDLYLMIHYELMSDSGTPLAKTLQSFLRITKSKEMIRFVDTAIGLIDTYGELEAVSRISMRYREVPEVTKLMRLIKQQNEGGDIKSELAGFRKQIIEDKRYIINKKVEGFVKKAEWSFNLTMIILIQAVVSAMAIYLPDLGIINL